jgi:hypothetical protein
VPLSPHSPVLHLFAQDLFFGIVVTEGQGVGAVGPLIPEDRQRQLGVTAVCSVLLLLLALVQQTNSLDLGDVGEELAVPLALFGVEVLLARLWVAARLCWRLGRMC